MAGDLGGAGLYYDGSVAAGVPAGRSERQVIEVRDGSENMVRRVVHNLQDIDGLVPQISKDGVVVVHQAERDRGGGLVVASWRFGKTSG